MTTLSLKVIDNVYDFHCFENSWEEFRAQTSANNPCLSWLWIDLWCKYYLREQDKLFIHVYYHNENIVGAFPVYLKKILFGYQLRFLATGEAEEAEICSEFQDFMLKSEYQKELLNLFSQEIVKAPNLIAYAFDNALSQSSVASWVNSFSFGWIKKTKSIGIRYMLAVESDQNIQLAALKSKTTKRQAKQYIANRDCTCEYLVGHNLIDNFFTELTYLHNYSWNERGQRGAFENKLFCEFHLNYIKKCHQQDKLVLFKILCKEETVAIFYGIVDGDILYYYQSGILRSDKLSSTGVAMHIEALNYARLNNLKQYDLMKGSVDSYKQRIVKEGQLVNNLIAFKRLYFWLPFYYKLKFKIKNI